MKSSVDHLILLSKKETRVRKLVRWTDIRKVCGIFTWANYCCILS